MSAERSTVVTEEDWSSAPANAEQEGMSSMEMYSLEVGLSRWKFVLTQESPPEKRPTQITNKGQDVLAQNLGVLNHVLVGANSWKSESARLKREQVHLL